MQQHSFHPLFDFDSIVDRLGWSGSFVSQE
jgi:hypothetical protein